MKSHQIFESYIRKLVENSDTVDLVDIGWKGTIQDNIRCVLGDNIRIRGYYFGLNKDTKRAQNNEKHGLIFDMLANSKNNSVYSYNCIHLERILSADHGQTLGYSYVGKNIEPILSHNPQDVEIYNYVDKWQKLMNNSILELIELLSNSTVDLNDIEYLITKSYLAYLMIDVPLNYKVFLTFRKKSKENFGNISQKKIINNSILSEKKVKREFYYVDYVFRIINKFHLNFLFLLGKFYCNFAFLIKSFGISK